MGKCRNGFLRRVDLFHQDYAEAIGFFGRELVDAAEAGGFQVFFWDTTAHELIADVFGSLDAKGRVLVVGACYLVGCTGDMHGENDTALSALYPYWLMGIDIFYFRIVKPVTMYFLCILDKLRCRFLHVLHMYQHSYDFHNFTTIAF